MTRVEDKNKLRRHEAHCQEAMQAYKDLEQYMKGLNFDAVVPIHFHCLSMASAVRETMYCMLHLRKLDSDFQMFPMLRQMMELSCYLAFIALKPDGNYEKIVVKDLTERLKFLNDFHSGDDDESAKQDIEKITNEKNDLVSVHGEAISMFEIVKAVGYDGFYSEYRFLSVFTHSNLVSLERRFQRDENGGVLPLKPMAVEDMDRLWPLAEEFLKSVIISMDILKEKLSAN